MKYFIKFVKVAIANFSLIASEEFDSEIVKRKI